MDVLARVGIDLPRDTSGKWLSSDQTWRSRRWLEDLGLTKDEALTVVGEVTARRRNGPPESLAYFDKEMEEAAGRKQAGSLEPALSERSKRPPPSLFGEGEENE